MSRTLLLCPPSFLPASTSHLPLEVWEVSRGCACTPVVDASAEIRVGLEGDGGDGQAQAHGWKEAGREKRGGTKGSAGGSNGGGGGRRGMKQPSSNPTAGSRNARIEGDMPGPGSQWDTSPTVRAQQTLHPNKHTKHNQGMGDAMPDRGDIVSR